MKRSTRNIVGAVAAFLLLALVVPPLISMGRFHARIDQSIGQAIGRQVTIGAVNLRLLPQPGFDLQRLVVADDPSFSAEPMLRADEVTAYLRLSSLWRGRLEIARLSLQNPSLNLVRRDGRWNVYALLERTAHTPSAPTAQSKPESRLRFPYIEADSGRINFKIGAEKKVYVLADADFALWQATEDRWHFRVKARPVRIDQNLSDTGTLQMEGSFQRASSLRETPLSVRLKWQNAQLGQLTQLIYGRDRGWRGALDLSAQLSGTPASLGVRADAQVQDFRRYDIINPGSLELRARCDARFSSIDQSWSDVACRAPVAVNGLLTANGSAVAPLSGGPYQFKLVAQQLPMLSVVAAAQHAKRDLPDDLTATGVLNASFRVSKSAQTGWLRSWSGDGQTSDFALSSELTGNQLKLGSIPFTVVGGARHLPARRMKSRAMQLPKLAPELRLALGPFRMQLEGGAPAVLYAWLSRNGYEVNLQGEAQLARLEQVARTLGVHTPPHVKKGTARLDLQITGLWTGFPPPEVTGKAQLHNLTADLKSVDAPLQISSAEVVLSPQRIKVQNLAAAFAGSGLHLSGSVQLVRQCPAGTVCPAEVNLHADQLGAAELVNLLHARAASRPWYRLLQRDREKPLAGLAIVGTLSANRMNVGGMAATYFTTHLAIQGGKVQLSQVRASIWGGQHSGEWQLDFSGRQPVYSGRGTLEHASLAQAAQNMGDDWASGKLALQYRLRAAGWNRTDLRDSLVSAAEFDVRDGVLRHLSLTTGAQPLRLRRFTGRLALSHGEFTLAAGKLQALDGIYQVSGTALLDSKLNIKLVRDSSHSFDITGTLGAPRVTLVPHPQREAALTK